MFALNKKVFPLIGTVLFLALSMTVTFPTQTAHAAAADSSGSVSFYRLVSKTTGAHFYTDSVTEALNAESNYNFKYEEIAANVFSSSGTSGTVPFYRLLSKDGVDHFYTTSWSEAYNAEVNYGYTYEEIAAYVFPASGGPSGTVPFYRLVSKSGAGHFYTTSWSEAYNAEVNYNYIYEGVAAYVYPAS